MREGAREQKEGGAKAGPANLIDTARDFMLGLHGGMHTDMTWDEVNSELLRSATGGTLVFLERDGLSRKFVDGECPEQPGDREEQDTLGHIDAWADTSTELGVSDREKWQWKNHGLTQHRNSSGRAPLRLPDEQTPQS